jgi:hypothetical protein
MLARLHGQSGCMNINNVNRSLRRGILVSVGHLGGGTPAAALVFSYRTRVNIPRPTAVAQTVTAANGVRRPKLNLFDMSWVRAFTNDCDPHRRKGPES